MISNLLRKRRAIPWNVQTWDNFCLYVCPECHFMDQDHNAFCDHALKTHEKAKIVWEDPSSLLSSAGKTTISTSTFLDDDYLDVEIDKKGAQNVSENKQKHKTSTINEEIGMSMDWDIEQEIECDATEPPKTKYHRDIVRWGILLCTRMSFKERPRKS